MAGLVRLRGAQNEAVSLTRLLVLVASKGWAQFFAMPLAALAQDGYQTRAVVGLADEGELLAQGTAQQLVLRAAFVPGLEQMVMVVAAFDPQG